MLSVWPISRNREGCVRAEEPWHGALAVQGVKESSPQPLCHLLIAHLHTCATQDGSIQGTLILMELLEHLLTCLHPFKLLKKIFFTKLKKKISSTSKSLKKFLGADLCLPTLYLQNKDIKKNFFYHLYQYFIKDISAPQI